MRGAPSTHTDTGLSILAFADEVWCRCPSCGGRAIARRSAAAHGARLTCTSCSSTRESSATSWLGPARGVARRRCRSCGEWLLARLSRRGPRPERPARVALRCAACGASAAVGVTWGPAPSSEPRDPWFGLPLLLDGRCSHGRVWAYNPRHLAELRRFVSATVRKRAAAVNGSFVSRLPAWMKAAGNREAVLRCIDRIQAGIGG